MGVDHNRLAVYARFINRKTAQALFGVQKEDAKNFPRRIFTDIVNERAEAFPVENRFSHEVSPYLAIGQRRTNSNPRLERLT